MAALLTPRRPDGAPNFEAFEASADFVLSRGGTGVIVAGGTGDYAALTVAERKLLLERCKAVAAGRGALICSNGAARIDDSVALAEHAFQTGVDAVLLPPPHFFRYSQEDLEEFYAEAARRIQGPILMYNLASFCTPIQPLTALRCLRAHDNIIGIKDSSGQLDTLRLLQERSDIDALRIVGHDRVFLEALRTGLLDGVISGPAGVVPEMTVALFDASASGDDGRLRSLEALFNELLERVDALPYPWALIEIAAIRGGAPAVYPFNPHRHRRAALDALHQWFPTWLERFSAVNLSRL